MEARYGWCNGYGGGRDGPFGPYWGVIDDTAIPAEAVRAELDRVLASKGFQNAGRLSRLLRHVTEKTLAGDADQLKEYAVGVEVFDRDASYDPRLDSIVRVEAGRLRSRLDEYYANGGLTSAIRIGLPRGGYVAQFTRREPGSSAGPKTTGVEPQVSNGTPRTVFILLAVSVLIVAALALWLSWRSRAEGPAVAVLAFSEHSDDAQLAGVAAALTDDVTSELARLGRVGVVSHTSAMQFAGVNKPLREIAAALNADFIVEATIENEPAGIKVVARIVNAATDRKMWVKDYHGRPDALHDLSREIADGIATAVVTRQPAR
jgi:TolB-like protein